MSDKVALVRLRANNSQYDRAMRDSAKLTGDLQRGLGRFDSSKLDELGSKLTRNVTLPLAALGGFAVKAAGTFDSVFTKMQTLAGVTAGEVDGLKESIFALSGETGRAPTELAEAMYFLRSSGLDAAESMRLSTLPDPHDAAAANEVVELLKSALGRLSPREREAFVLVVLEQNSPQEAAETLAIGESSVRSLVTLARRRLRQLLGPSLASNVADADAKELP